MIKVLKTLRTAALLAAISLALPPGRIGPANADTLGMFVANGRCPAFQSIRKQTNPGDIATRPDTAYKTIAVNGDKPTHYRIVVPDAVPPERWVSMDCGGLAGSAETPAAASHGSKSPTEKAARSDGRGADALSQALGGPQASPSTRERQQGDREASTRQRSPSGSYVLAASWHPTFCESRPRSRDCRSGGEEDGLVLHGLWPQPRGAEYCGVSEEIVSVDSQGSWQDLPRPNLSTETEHGLEEVMPGFVANLHRHEWIKHGTCYGADAEEYFVDSIALIEMLNASPVGALFQSNRGLELTSDEIRAAFDKAFGRGAGKRVLVDCNLDDGREIINELRINLQGTITPDSDFGDLISNAPTAPRGCPSGIVDRRGNQ